MSTEYGIFNEDGCIEDGFFSQGEAEERAVSWRTFGEACTVHQLCPDHPEQPDNACEECGGEE